MESKTKIGIAVVAITSFAAFSIIFAAHFHRRRKQRRFNGACYLHSDQSKVQSTFKRVVADNSYSPFKHLDLNLSDNRDKMSNSHPYEAEITSLFEEPQLDVDLVNENKDMELSDSYVWVETEDKLQELVDVLGKERVFGVDTEQHSMRSFLGFTALIQISTRKEDYLVDTIALHDVMGVLRPVFANPKILKVFHGADNDVLWLQRDFHIYVVNLFDTAKACDVLSKPQKSLAYLLETYCGVNTNKLLQREDWRQRPLSLEMVQYARTDAHYLLYIANCLISELKEQSNENSACLTDTSNLLLEASRRSNMTCLQLYTKDVEEYPGESAASSILYKHSNGQGDHPAKTSANKYQDLVRQLCAWRDIMARIHDENVRYVLSDQAIVALANKSHRTQTEIFSTISEADLLVESVGFNIVQSPSPVVCSHVEDLCYFFKDNVWNPDVIFNICLKHHLGPNGSCLLSILNYSLLSKSNMKPVNKLGPIQNGVRRSKQVSRKASRELFVQKFSCKSPVYHNCRIYANDGRLLCYCDRRKLEWYVRRDLAKLVDENPPAIMLLFEPKGRPEDEGNDFYVQTKKNICVGCGEKNHYLRYRIIPSCYRVHFPENMKSHRSHDIVLVCVDCHEVAHAAAERYKRQIAAELKIPLFVQKVQASSKTSESTCNVEESGVSPLQLRTSAMALLRHGPTMPAKRREELTQILMKYFGRADISKEDLETALLLGMSPHERRKLEKKKGMSFKHPNGSILAEEVEGEDCEKQENRKTEDVEPSGNMDKYESQSSVNGNMDFSHSSKLSLLGHGPHGKQVVDHILKEFGEEGISQFCQKWRQVFVETVHPRFLAPGWDVMHSGRREFGEFSVFSSSTKTSADAED